MFRVRSQVMFVVLILLSALFMTGNVAQESEAWAHGCSVLDARCSCWRGIASYICTKYGSTSVACANALGVAYAHCYYWYANCGGG